MASTVAPLHVKIAIFTWSVWVAIRGEKPLVVKSTECGLSSEIMWK